LGDLVQVPVIAPEQPQLALARGAALASASAPRYDTATIGLAYSQDPDETAVSPIAPVGEATTFLGYADVPTDAADVASDSDVPERSKSFLSAGSWLAAVFIVGMMALTIAMVVNVRPTARTDSDDMAVHPGAAAPTPALQGAPPAVPQLLPKTVPPPAPAPPPPARVAMAQMMELPAPPRQAVVHNAAPAPAALPPAPAAPLPAPAPPPPIALPPGIPPLVIEWLPPIVQPPPPFFNPGPIGRGPGHGGGHGGKHGGD
jgi:hypothetical protein